MQTRCEILIWYDKGQVMEEELISIVIPVYNGEQYLKRCIDSVINQTYRNLDVIIINDGSSDHTREICEQYAFKDERIRFIEQINHGVSYTRKYGIRLAKGKYVGFVDADDFIDKDLFGQMHDIMAQTGVDLLFSECYFGEKQRHIDFPEGVYGSKDEMEKIYRSMIISEDGKGGIPTELWAKLFLKEKLEDILEEISDELFIGEDAELLFKYILRCQSVFSSKICGYHYVMNDKSLMRSVNNKYLCNVNLLYLSLAREFEKSDYKDVFMPQLEHWIWNMIKQSPRFMGMNIKRKICYLNPFDNVLNSSKMILYGAGLVGRDYYELYKKKGEEPLLWVDQNWEHLQTESMPVCSIEQIKQVDFEYLLIAIKNKKQACEIKELLIHVGVAADKIIWKEPIFLD